MDRLFLAVITSALLLLIASASLLVYGTQTSAALLRLPTDQPPLPALRAHAQIANGPEPLLPVSTRR
jgi:hypothetical protein